MEILSERMFFPCSSFRLSSRFEPIACVKKSKFHGIPCWAIYGVIVKKLTFGAQHGILSLRRRCSPKCLCSDTRSNPPRKPRVIRAPSRARSRGATSRILWSGQSGRPLESPLQNRVKYQVPHLSPVVPEAVLIQIALQIFSAYRVVDSADSPLHQTP